MTSWYNENLLGYICEYADASIHSFVQIIDQRHIDEMIEVTLKVLAYVQQNSGPKRTITCKFKVWWAADFSFLKPHKFSMRVLRDVDVAEAIDLLKSQIQ